MQKYIWTEQYSVGVKEIDEQHQHFFAIANDIIEIAGQENIEIRELLFKITNLNNYVVYHLLTEENIFQRYNYPDARIHVRAHNDYREKMRQFMSEADKVNGEAREGDLGQKEGANTKDLALKIAQFSGDWLTNHILVMDHKYIAFMHEAGIK